MIRFYRLCVCVCGKYDLREYYLDLAAASSAAIQLAGTMSTDSRVVVSQIDVYPSSSVIRHVVTIDGLNA